MKKAIVKPAVNHQLTGWDFATKHPLVTAFLVCTVLKSIQNAIDTIHSACIKLSGTDSKTKKK